MEIETFFTWVKKDKDLCKVRAFPPGGMRGVPPPAHSPHLDKSPTNKFLSPPPKVNSPPTKQQFSSYNPIKTAFLAVVIAPAPFLF